MSKVNLEDLSEEQLAEALQAKKSANELAKKADRKQYRDKKEAFCKASAERFKELHKQLKKIKQKTCDMVQELHDEMYALEDKVPPAKKTFYIKSADDQIKIVIDRQERFEFTAEAAVHINAIRDIFKAKFADRNKSMYSLLDSLLVKNSNNDYDPKLLAKARIQVRELGYQDLISEFDKLDECQQVTGTAQYCRVYQRDKDNKWQDISLQFSSL